jgi:acyl carrier protein
VRVHAPLTARLRSWVKSHPTNRADGAVLLFDAVVLDEDGRVCLEVEELALRSVPREFDLAARVASLVPVSNGHARASNGHATESNGHASATSGHTHGVETPATAARSRGRSALQRNLAHGIAPAEGMEALMRILAAPELRQVVATSLDLAGLLRQADALGAAPGLAQRAGPEPELEREFAASPDGIERTLAGFWQELLGVRRVGLRESFFDLGGHSLIAVRLFARIQKTFQVEFPISLLFEAPTIERCAAVIRNA